MTIGLGDNIFLMKELLMGIICSIKFLVINLDSSILN